MVISNIKELKQLILMCQKLNVKHIKINDIELELGEAPQRLKPAVSPSSFISTSGDALANGITEDTKIPTDGLTPEQLLYWSTNEPIEGSETLS